VVSSDRLRAVVGSGEHDLDASADTFALLDQIVVARIKRGLTTVVDTLGLEADRRRAQLGLARRAGLPAVAVLFDTEPAVCRRRPGGPARRAGLRAADLPVPVAGRPGRAWEPIPEPWVTLGLLAGVAPGLRLGTLVTPVTFRAPGILAKTVATLDVLTGGRAFCGIGAGWWDWEHSSARTAASAPRSWSGCAAAPPAATFAARHHAGTAADHIGRYRLLADHGVATVFVSLPDLAGPQDVLRLASVTAAFRSG
jgi:hypothetical protein